MTREEAKQILRINKPVIKRTSISARRYVEAFDMAISALSENKGEWTRHTRVEPVYSIDGVKTWGDKCQCNKCTFTTIAVEGFGYYNFCPNCGADMRGGE